MSRRKQKNFSCLFSFIRFSNTRISRIEDLKKKKKRRKKGTANCNACNPVDSNKKTQKGENKSNNLKTAASKFKYSLIVGQQTKPSRYKKKKKIYSMSLLKRISLKRFVNKISPRCLCNIRITISNFIFTSFIDF